MPILSNISGIDMQVRQERGFELVIRDGPGVNLGEEFLNRLGKKPGAVKTGFD